MDERWHAAAGIDVVSAAKKTESSVLPPAKSSSSFILGIRKKKREFRSETQTKGYRKISVVNHWTVVVLRSISRSMMSQVVHFHAYRKAMNLGIVLRTSQNNVPLVGMRENIKAKREKERGEEGIGKGWEKGMKSKDTSILFYLTTREVNFKDDDDNDDDGHRENFTLEIKNQMKRDAEIYISISRNLP
ncbi:hypothetical protein V1477_019593 [Vespula maculifrons]|uniref:Uncharacterized protein n=1 Tax=Vespula maculifrons TaxID=7453 RepID=A0ABD2AQV4_VESMC